jgi:hypothetical protein
MPTKTIPLAGPSTRRGYYATSVTKDQRFIGAIPTLVPNALTKEALLYLDKRPGFVTTATPASGKNGQFIFVSPTTNDRISAFETGGVVTIYNNQTSCGTLTAGVTVYGIIEVVFSNTVYWMISGNNSADLDTKGEGYYLTGTSLTKITDPDFPIDCVGSFVELDGYILIGTHSGNVRNSDLNSPSAWSALGSIAANSLSDRMVGMARHRTQLIAFSTSSMEFFYNAGNPVGSPLKKSEALFSYVGCNQGLNRGAPITRIGEYMAWQAYVGGGFTSTAIYTLTGYEPKKISTPIIDRAMGNAEVSLDGFFFGGMHFLHMAIGTTTTLLESWLYCFETDSWMESGFPYYLRISGTGTLYSVAVNDTGGKVFYQSDASDIVYQDSGAAYTMTVQTARLLEGENFKRYKRVALIADTQASGNTAVEFSYDDYANFTTPRNIDMTLARKELWMCGTGKHLIVRLKHNDNTPWRGQALIVEYDELMR